MAKEWYVLRVQVGREDTIREGLLRRVKSANLEEQISRVLVPSERVSEIKGGKRRVTEKKIFPGYLMVEMDCTEDAWYLIRETPGIGDFIGSRGAPVPMERKDVDRILTDMERPTDQPKLRIEFQKGAHIRIKDGPFLNFEGTVEEVNPEKGLVKVIVTIFGRATPVELEYWQVEAV
ncbi:MAG: transcription termination/antitermination protein NusG [Planctomycetales bacterium]|nr:transcription termination/antitermination protein NusG [Planctomycetales bacterium]